MKLRRWGNNTLLLFTLFLVMFPGKLNSQAKFWFTNPGMADCSDCLTGIAPVSYKKDSLYQQSLFRAAADEYMLLNFTRLTVSRETIASDAGNFLSVNDISRTITDSSAYPRFEDYILADSFSVTGGTAAIFCRQKDRTFKIIKESEARPEWTEITPVRDGCLFSAGAAQAFYYEKSSWDAATLSALVNLAAVFKSRMTSDLFYHNSGSVLVLNGEYLEAELKNVSVTERYHDEKQNIYYVLLRIDLK